MADKNVKLAVIDGETLMDMKLPPTKFCVETLLPQGMCILGGASKIGKSWWVLDLCVRIAKGEPMWDLKTTKGTTLYLCLEDTLRRVQNRLLCITDEVPPNTFFAISAGTLSDGLCEQIREFVKEHPDTVFVAVDTFQIVRNNNIDTSYANDYDEIRLLKQLADELNICLLLVHHLRKQGDSDPFNKLTGTTGIVGAVDTAFVLDKSKRNADSATLYCTGRDVEDRQLELQFSKKDFVWKMLRDSMENREMLLPKEMELLIEFMKVQKSYSGSNTELRDTVSSNRATWRIAFTLPTTTRNGMLTATESFARLRYTTTAVIIITTVPLRTELRMTSAMTFLPTFMKARQRRIRSTV